MHPLQPIGIIKEEECLYLYGDVCYETIDRFLEQWENLLKEQSDLKVIVISCEHLLKADSSLVALLIEIRRTSIERNIPFNLKHIPESLERFISVYGLNEFLLS